MRNGIETVLGKIVARDPTTNDLVGLLQLFALDEHPASICTVVHDLQLRC